MNMTMTTQTMEKGLVFEQVKDARPFVKQGDVLHCLLTRTYEKVGIFANAFIEKDGKTVSVSGLFKDFFGNEGTYVWAKVAKFDSKGKISFVLCEAPSETIEKVEPTAIAQEKVDMAAMEAAIRADFEKELNEAKEAMRIEFGKKLQEAEEAMKENLRKEEAKKVTDEISKVTGKVSPKANEMIEVLLKKVPASEVGKALAVVSANFDASSEFVSQMEKIVWGCL